MMVIELDMYQACALGALIFCLGQFLVQKVKLLNKYCIPAAVAGGVSFAFIHLALYEAGILEFNFDTTIQTILMCVFFCSVGFTACFRLLKKGGIQTLVFLVLSIIMCVIQNGLGSGLCAAFGIDPLLGLCMGSMPLVGGHGTSASFGPLLEEAPYLVDGALTVALASATFGLVAGSLMGGPIARARIEKLGLKSTATESGEVSEEKNGAIDVDRFTSAAVFIVVAVGLGTYVFSFFKSINFTLPVYIGAMLVAALFRNVWDVRGKELPLEEIDTIGGVALSIYLSMAMMNLKLWDLADLALPMIIILIAQTIVMYLYANFVIFNIMGRDMEAASMTAAFCGFGMGATANAMANMKALTDKYGPTPRAFFIVPLCGSVFVDFFNAMILTGFMNAL